MFSSGSRLRGTWRKAGCFGPESRMEGLIPKEDPATGGKKTGGPGRTGAS